MKWKGELKNISIETTTLQYKKGIIQKEYMEKL